MKIKFINRKEVVNSYLDQMNNGTKLTNEQKRIVKNLSK